MSDKSTFGVNGACVNLEVPCDKRHLEMLEQFVAKVALCFGCKGKYGDECLQSISVVTGTVLQASESMPFSRLLVDLSVRENVLTVHVEYYRDDFDENVESQPIEQLLRVLNNENKLWDEMV